MILLMDKHLRLTHPTSDGGTIAFNARIVKREADAIWVEIPARVRRMPFPPVSGKRYAKYNVKDLVRA